MEIRQQLETPRWMDGFTHSFYRYMVIERYYVPGTPPDAKNMGINQTVQIPILMEQYDGEMSKMQARKLTHKLISDGDKHSEKAGIGMA